ncbi:histidine kinase/DNA gyrase B/HSP90-like ATPase [Mobilisporobacter senegalensis]|uniref:histidine kinase n=1 Tax=Mobilisporobacter senegalensis TaxID=1329262 RepID=A0A3N1XF17_9FIRM|nr:ATP-binding protein [Mobilisporobacter senegalensis]ROR25313.1 histidine kinase/DNA gyrase B/HSP90-like ATPase [Mobilisporobacter senegalensis]
MLLLLMLFFMIASILLLIVRRNKESFYLLGMCLSLAIQLTGILIYIAKKGGISRELQEFFFLSLKIKTKIQYLLITLDLLGTIIAVGRYLFPLFLLLLAIKYSMIPWIRRGKWLNAAVLILPILSLILYNPRIFRILTLNRPRLQSVIISASSYWIILYVAIAFILLIIELSSITMKFCKKQFIQIIIFITSISIVYLLYCGQDPAQVYQFYSNDFLWRNGIYYMNSTLSIQAYITIVVGNVIAGILGFASLLKYTQGNFEDNREEFVMKNKFDSVSFGASVFVHSIKNQLLANRVIHKRIQQVYEKDTVDINQLREYINTLSEQNEIMLTRLDELYRSVKSNSIYLVPVLVEEIVKCAIERFHNKYPDKHIEIELRTKATILADKTHLCEAVYNLLVNAQDAVTEANRGDEGKVSLIIHNERLYTVIEIRDNGTGINDKVMKKMFEPFYSSKNSNYNWGMGLYYVRAIAKGHFGSLRYESKEGKGSSFYILLPKYME